mgnify:CR=1 FL=1
MCVGSKNLLTVGRLALMGLLVGALPFPSTNAMSCLEAVQTTLTASKKSEPMTITEEQAKDYLRWRIKRFVDRGKISLNALSFWAAENDLVGVTEIDILRALAPRGDIFKQIQSWNLPYTSEQIRGAWSGILNRVALAQAMFREHQFRVSSTTIKDLPVEIVTELIQRHHLGSRPKTLGNDLVRMFGSYDLLWQLAGIPSASSTSKETKWNTESKIRFLRWYIQLPDPDGLSLNRRVMQWAALQASTTDVDKFLKSFHGIHGTPWNAVLEKSDLTEQERKILSKTHLGAMMEFPKFITEDLQLPFIKGTFHKDAKERISDWLNSRGIWEDPVTFAEVTSRRYGGRGLWLDAAGVNRVERLLPAMRWTRTNLKHYLRFRAMTTQIGLPKEFQRVRWWAHNNFLRFTLQEDLIDALAEQGSLTDLLNEAGVSSDVQLLLANDWPLLKYVKAIQILHESGIEFKTTIPRDPQLKARAETALRAAGLEIDLNKFMPQMPKQAPKQMLMVLAGLAPVIPKENSANDQQTELELWRKFKLSTKKKEKSELRKQIAERYLEHMQNLARSTRINKDLKEFFSIGEVESWALTGLFEAIDSFDPAERVAFEGFSRQRIIGAVIDGARASGPISRTYYLRKEQWEEMTHTLHNQLSRPPTEEEIQQALGWSDEILTNLRKAIRKAQAEGHTTQEKKANRSEEILRPTPLVELEPSENLERDDFWNSITKSLKNRTRTAFLMYYRDNLTFKEISIELNISEATVNLDVNAALKIIRAEWLDHEEELMELLQ